MLIMPQESKLTATTQQKNSTFYLCEKPSQARTLAKILGAAQGPDKMHFGDGVVIGHAFGHMLNLAMPEEYIDKGPWRLDNLPIVPGKWIWKVKEEHREHFENIGEYLRKSNTVVIATDPDEEGEVIGRQILLAHGYTGKVLRLWMSALEPESLKKSLQNLLPLSATDHFYHAGRVRHEMDWLFGMNLSRAFSIILKEQAHIGRVKTRLLNEIVTTDQQSENVKQDGGETAYVMLGDTLFELQWPDEPHDYKVDFKKLDGEQRGIYLKDESYCYTDEMGIPLEQTTPLPYTLTALLADAADIGISLNEGYKAVQKLYESGTISYPRTNSTKMPGTSDDFAVHHAIVTVTDGLPCGMTEAATRIFELIHLNQLYQKNRLILIDRMQTIEIGGVYFSSREQWMTIPADSPDRELLENQNILANLKRMAIGKNGDAVQVKVHLTRENYGKPKYFNEASLLRMMAKKGIGTESTRVAVIANLIKEKLIDVTPQSDHEGVPLTRARIIRSTQLGRELISRLPDEVTGSTMESQLQQALEDVRAGQSDESVLLMNTAKWIVQTIRSMDKISCP
jgi:DNA topoisomerase-3